MKTLLNETREVDEAALTAIAYMPTKSLPMLMDEGFSKKLTDEHFMRIAFMLAKKSYEEGGCPIGAVVVNDSTNAIVGKGHNTLVQDGDPYNHGETAAIRDAGRIDFSKTTIYTSLSPCDVCTALIHMRGFERVVVGDMTNASGNEPVLEERGIKVERLEIEEGVKLYAKYRAEKPDLDLEDWMGVSAVVKKKADRE
ncbi:MAG: nucleoside deaminase [Verrucomicrobiota bacterium]